MPSRRATPAELLAAARFAADKHRSQRRKDREASPYVNHPIQVAELLARVGRVTDRDVLLAAILHDTLEDTETNRAELARAFGARVAKLVREVSDDKTLPKRRRKQLQVEHAPHLSRGAKLIKLGDLTCNVGDLASSPPKSWRRARRLGYVKWSREVIAGCRGVNAALEREFDRAVRRARLSRGRR